MDIASPSLFPSSATEARRRTRRVIVCTTNSGRVFITKQFLPTETRETTKACTVGSSADGRLRLRLPKSVPTARAVGYAEADSRNNSSPLGTSLRRKLRNAGANLVSRKSSSVTTAAVPPYLTCANTHASAAALGKTPGSGNKSKQVKVLPPLFLEKKSVSPVLGVYWTMYGQQSG